MLKGLPSCAVLDSSRTSREGDCCRLQLADTPVAQFHSSQRCHLPRGWRTMGKWQHNELVGTVSMPDGVHNAVCTIFSLCMVRSFRAYPVLTAARQLNIWKPWAATQSAARPAVAFSPSSSTCAAAVVSLARDAVGCAAPRCDALPQLWHCSRRFPLSTATKSPSEGHFDDAFGLVLVCSWPFTPTDPVARSTVRSSSEQTSTVSDACIS